MPQELPERPNLEQLKKQAKSLLHAAQAGEAAALRRFAALPAFSKKSISDLGAVGLALHDAQSVIAREHGFASWKELREEVETRTLSFDAAVDEFVRCATGDAPDRAQRLLTLHPGIASATLQTALVLGDVAAVEHRLHKHTELATEPGGVHKWEPLLYVCHTYMHRLVPSRVDGLVAIARRLCSLGANPNAEYHWQWHPELPRTALWAATCAVGHLPLAEALLEAGANPTDGVSMHIASSGGNLAALDLLHRYGVNVDGIPGGVPPLVYMMSFARDPAGPYWLLDHGADPNLAWGDAGEAPLHVAARRWNVAMVEQLAAHGADVMQRRADGATAHKIAEIYGNHDIAMWLLGHGAKDELSQLDRFVAACARGDHPLAAQLLRETPALREELGHEHHLMLHRPAETGNVAVLETMLECGFDPRVKDKDNVTALHRAAMAGYADAVRVLLAHGADVNAHDGMFAATPLVWAVEGRNTRKDPRADHVAVARLLIAAGSSVDWTPPEGSPPPEGTIEGLIELTREAASP